MPGNCWFHKISQITVTILGFVIFLVGLLLVICFFNAELLNALLITPTSMRYRAWIDPKINNYMHVYLFNWTNHEDYEKNATQIPIFSEVGPFVFKERNLVTPISWNPEKQSLTFKRQRTWIIDNASSYASLSINITNLNILALLIAQDFRFEKDNKTERIVDFYLSKKESLVRTLPARQLLFDGYYDLVVKNLNDIKGVDVTVPMSTFGWFYGKNHTFYEGFFEMDTGSDSGKLASWNGSEKTKFYNDKCSLISGSLSDITSTFHKDNILLFETDICRPKSYSYESSRVGDLTLKKYVGDIYDDRFLDRDTNCSCVGECTLPGVLNVSLCYEGLPLFTSYPHFLNSNPYYTNSIGGMKPNLESHQSYIIVEEKSGIPVEAQQTRQFNLLLQPNKYKRYRNVSRVFVPMLWYKEYWKADETFSQELSDTLQKWLTNTRWRIFAHCLWVFGLLLLLIVTALFLVKGSGRYQPENTSLLTNEE